MGGGLLRVAGVLLLLHHPGGRAIGGQAGDGEGIGQSLLVHSVDSGRHQLRLQKDGYEAFEQWYSVTDNNTQTVLVKALIPNSNDALRQSQFIRARVVWGKHNNPEVPILAVSRLAGQYFAFVAEPQPGGAYIARQKPLKIGQTVGNDFEVQDGIKPGDKIIISGTQFLLDGAPVIPLS